MPARVFVGYDGSESRAFSVCVKSIIRRSSIAVDIYPIRQEWLRSLGLYHRERDPRAATEFSFTRFLVPCLAGYHGVALFVDCDFLFLADIAELFALYDPKYAIQCVKHEHVPVNTEKMGGVEQTKYHRKNWSSLVIYNCDHSSIRENLIPHNVNIQSGAWLHQFQFLKDEDIGSLPKEWNWLHTDGENPNAKAIHLTEGVRAIHGDDTLYSDLWEVEEKA